MDLELVDRARRGDHDAFRLIAEPVYDLCYGVACRVLGDGPAAEDATQQALLDIWDKLPGLRDVARFKAWCYRIVVHASYAEARKAKRAMHGPLPEDHDLRPTADEFHVIVDRDQVSRAFERQRVEHRAVLVLRYYADLTVDEIAAILEIPSGTVKSRLHHGLRAMRATIEADARMPERDEGDLSPVPARSVTRWSA